MLAAGGRAAPLLTLETACPVMTQGGDSVIVEWLEENPHARLVIIDTFEKMRGTDAPGQSAYAGDYAAATRFKKIADHYGVPILLIHHVRKQGAEDFQSLVSGTNGLTGAMDAILVLERGRGQSDGVLHVTGRDVEEADYAMSFDAHSGAWTKLDGPAGDYQLGDTRADIVRLLREHGGMKPARIADALQLNPNTVRQTCTRMAKDGQLKAVPGGTYTVPAAGSDTDDTPALSHLSLSHSTATEQQEQE
jgi:hypothetical protein